MKVVFLFYVLLLGTAVSAQETYQKNFNIGYTDLLLNFKTAKENGYLIAGATKIPGTDNKDAYCIRLDSTGNLLWAKTYGNTYTDAETICNSNADGGFLLSFKSYNASSLNGDSTKSVSLLKCNKSGTVEWVRCLKNPHPEEYDVSITPSYIYESKEGDIYLLCDHFSFGEALQFTLFKLDALGNFKWKKSIVGSYYYSDYQALQIVELKNGNIVVAENAYGDDFYTSGAYIHLFFFDEQTGIIRQSKRISQMYNGGYHAYVTATSLTAEDNNLRITGLYSRHGYTNDSVYTFLLSAQDTSVKAVYIPYKDYHSYQYLANKKIIKQPQEGFWYNLIFTKDKGYLYIRTDGTPNYNVIIEKHDSDGRVCPNFTVTAIDTFLNKTVFGVTDQTYRVVKNAVLLIDTSVVVTDITATQTLVCSGSFKTSPDAIANQSSEDLPACAKPV